MIKLMLDQEETKSYLLHSFYLGSRHTEEYLPLYVIGKGRKQNSFRRPLSSRL